MFHIYLHINALFELLSTHTYTIYLSFSSFNKCCYIIYHILIIRDIKCMQYSIVSWYVIGCFIGCFNYEPRVYVISALERMSYYVLAKSMISYLHFRYIYCNSILIQCPLLFESTWWLAEHYNVNIHWSTCILEYSPS